MRWGLVGSALLVGACASEPAEYGDYAGGVVVYRVGIMQGVDNVLYREGRLPERDVPVVARRDGLLRFYLNIGDDWEDRDLTGVLRLRDRASGIELETLTSTQFISERSDTDNLDSSINFRLTGEQIRQFTEFRFELREADTSRRGGSEDDAVFDSEVNMQGFGAQPTDPLTLVIVPIRYQADGSNRVPDISTGHIDEIQEAMYALYPTNEVTVRVENPLDWPDAITPGGGGWGNLLATMNNRAARADERRNTYYYGLFNSEDSFRDYCRAGCILGLATLATQVEDFPRAAIGIGYRGAAVETLVHEVGHSHGLRHAPCGRASAVDQDYPYDDAEVGVWGYNLVSEQLRPPERHDMMSYCDPIWISDYNYNLLHERILEVRDISRSRLVEVTRLYVDGTGTAFNRGVVEVREPGVGQTVPVDLYDASGKLLRTVEGVFEPYTHLEGGAVVLTEVLDDGVTARARL